jgi:hypothetical protein
MSPRTAKPRGTKQDRYIRSDSQRISLFPMPTTNPGESRNVQSWLATSDLPTVTDEPGSPPAAPAKSSGQDRKEADAADVDEAAPNETSRDIAQSDLRG